jgi:hypothetical protein
MSRRASRLFLLSACLIADNTFPAGQRVAINVQILFEIKLTRHYTALKKNINSISEGGLI